MARAIAIVNATQVITSESNPQGLFSVVSGFPKVFDSGSVATSNRTFQSAITLKGDSGNILNGQYGIVNKWT